MTYKLAYINEQKNSHAPIKEHDRLTEEEVQIAKIRSSQRY